MLDSSSRSGFSSSAGWRRKNGRRKGLRGGSDRWQTSERGPRERADLLPPYPAEQTATDFWDYEASAERPVPPLPNTEGENVSPVKIVAVLLIVGGILGLVYGGFSYTKSTREAKLGPLEFEVKEKERVNVPMWAGVGAIVVGAGLLLVRPKG